MLGDDDLGHAPIGGVLVVDLVAVDEHDDVGVLLDGARLAQVRQHGPLVAAGLEVPAELRQRHDRRLELAGQDLEATRDLRYLHLAVLGVRAAAHELQVVDHDEAEAAEPAAQPPGLGPYLGDGHVRVVVDVHGRVAQAAHAARDAVPLLRAQLTGAHSGGVDTGVGGQQATGQLGMVHLEREEQDGLVQFECHAGGHRQRQRRLAHGRTGTHHHHRRRLDARQDAVERGEAGCEARERVAPLVQFFEPVKALVQQVVQGLGGVDDAALGHAEDQRLCLVDGRGRVGRAAVRQLGDLPRHADQAAQQRVVFHDARVAVDVGERGRGGFEGQQALRAPGRGEIPGALELVGDRQAVDRLGGDVERLDRVEHETVRRHVEVVGREALHRGPDGVGGQQHRAEHRFLGVDVLRRHAPRGTAGRVHRQLGETHGCPAFTSGLVDRKSKNRWTSC